MEINYKSWYKGSFSDLELFYFRAFDCLAKPLKVILTKRFVLIKQNRNFKRKNEDKQFKYKIISIRL